MLPIGFKKVHRLFHRPKDFEGVGFFSCVCIDVEGAPEVWSGLVGGVEPDADIRRIAFGQHGLLEFGGQAFAGWINGVNDELPVTSIPIDKVEGIAGIVLTEREVADGIVEHDGRRCRAFPRARAEQAELNGEQDGNKPFGMIHHNVQIKKLCIERREGAQIRTFSIKYLIQKNLLSSNNNWSSGREGTTNLQLGTSNPSKY